MKYKTTRSVVNNGYVTRISVGYCNLQSLLNYINPVSYTCGVYGWNADIYEIGDIAIITGYRPFGNISPSYDICQKYEEEANKIRNNFTISWEKEKELLNELIITFIKEVA